MTRFAVVGELSQIKFHFWKKVQTCFEEQGNYLHGGRQS